MIGNFKEMVAKGYWVFFGFPADVTEEEIIQFFADLGIAELTADRIAIHPEIRRDGVSRGALICFDKSVLARLLSWAIGDTKIRGRFSVRPQVPGEKSW